MAKIENKRKKIFDSRITLIVFIFLVIFLGGSVLERYEKSKEANEARVNSEKELLELERRGLNLSNKIEKLETERGMEEIIREDFDVAKEGEGVIVIVNEDSKTGEEREDGNNSFLQRIIKFFKFQ